jgi:hypothetical protein
MQINIFLLVEIATVLKYNFYCKLFNNSDETVSVAVKVIKAAGDARFGMGISHEE